MDLSDPNNKNNPISTLLLIPLFVLVLLAGCNGSQVDIKQPEELANSSILKEMTNLNNLPILYERRHLQKTSRQRDGEPPYIGVTDESIAFLGEIFQFPENFDANHFECASEGADIHPDPIIPFVFDNNACEQDYIKGVLLARFEGSGVLSRFWLTQFTAMFPAFKGEVLRVYIDDQAEPILSNTLDAFYKGEAGEYTAFPFGAETNGYIAWHYPISFKRNITVTLDRLSTALDAYYFQVNVNLNDHDQTPDVLPTRDPLRDEVIRSLTESTLDASNADIYTLNANDHVVDIGGAGMIKRITLQFPKDKLEDMREVNLTVFWDEQPSAAIELPLLDLFASSQAMVNKNSRVLKWVDLGTELVQLELDLPMPFFTGAHVALDMPVNLNTDFQLNLAVTPDVLPAGNWGYLHTQLNETFSPASSSYHPLLLQEGKGKLVGNCVQLQGQSNDGLGGSLPYSFLEGDEIAIIDGEKTVHGTGAEDYFDSSFYFANIIETPFAQTWGKTRDPLTNEENVSSCRWHLFADGIEFQKSIDFKLEIGSLTPEALKQYRSTTYYYLD